MTADRDLDRVVRSWLREDGREDADRVLDLVLDELDTTPQRRAGWLKRRLSSMNSNPVRLGAIAAAAIVVAILGFSLVRSGDVGEADRSPTPSPGSATPAPSAAPDGGVPAGMLDVQYLADGQLRFFPADDAACTSIPVDGACFHWETWWGLVEGPAVFADGAVSLTAERCSSCDTEWEVFSGTTTILEIRAGGESLLVEGCDEGPCIGLQDNTFRRVGLGLPFPPEQTDEEAQQYGWPSYDNVLTFTLPAHWDANGGILHRHPDEGVRDGSEVEVRFAHMCRLGGRAPASCDGETYTPEGTDEVGVVVAGYQGWYRELAPPAGRGRLEEWILDVNGGWVSIQLTTGPDADPAGVDEAMQLLESIQAAPRD